MLDERKYYKLPFNYERTSFKENSLLTGLRPGTLTLQQELWKVCLAFLQNNRSINFNFNVQCTEQLNTLPDNPMQLVIINVKEY